MSAAAAGGRRLSRPRLAPVPAFYYQSPSAVVDGDVRFGEGCVVLPHARIIVPHGVRLHIGPFNLFDDFSALLVETTSHGGDGGGGARDTGRPPAGASNENCDGAAAPPLVLCLGSFNHLHSYATVRVVVPARETAALAATGGAASSSPSPGPAPCSRPRVVMGNGNAVHSFASAHLMMTSSPATPLGDFNVVTTHTSVALPLPTHAEEHPDVNVNARAASSPQPVLPGTADASARTAPSQPTSSTDVNPTAPRPSEVQASLLPGQQVQQEAAATLLLRAAGTPWQVRAASSAPAPSVETQPPGRTSVEERLFQDDDVVATAVREVGLAAAPHEAPGAASSASPVQPSVDFETSRRRADAAICTAALCHIVYLSRPARSRDGARSMMSASPAVAPGSVCAVPRYGTRSVAELPIVIRRIADEAKEAARGTSAAAGELPSALSPTSPPPPSASSAAGAAHVGGTPARLALDAVPAALALAQYISDVHPDLRQHAEARLATEVERLCRFYVHRFIDDDAGLRVVDAQTTL